MRLGISLNPGSSPFNQIADLAFAAEQAGVDTLYLREDHFGTGKGFANPYAVAAAIAGRLQRAWLAVRPSVELEHPLRLVEQGNLLDVLTHGRSLMVLADDTDATQYARFGLPSPRDGRGRFEDLVERMLDTWSWRYQVDGPPLDFTSGPYSARMAGRVMPSPCRLPHPLLVRETSADVAVVEAARRGWPVQIPADRMCGLVETYYESLSGAGHSASTLEECRNWTVVVVPVSSTDMDVRALIKQVETCNVAEARLDLARDVALDPILRQVA